MGSVGWGLELDGSTTGTVWRMELECMREKAQVCQSVLKYLEPRYELKLVWKSCLDIGSGYLDSISNTIRGKGSTYERISGITSGPLTITQKIMINKGKSGDRTEQAEEEAEESFREI